MGYVPLPALTPGTMARRGERIIDRIYFWNELPIFGRFITEWLADKLDACSQWLEDYAEFMARPPAPPMGGSAVHIPAFDDRRPQCACGCPVGTCKACTGQGRRVGAPSVVLENCYSAPGDVRVWGRNGVWSEDEVAAAVGGDEMVKAWGVVELRGRSTAIKRLDTRGKAGTRFDVAVPIAPQPVRPPAEPFELPQGNAKLPPMQLVSHLWYCPCCHSHFPNEVLAKLHDCRP